MKVLDAKRARINAEWADLSKESDELEVEQNLIKIIDLLQDEPAKIKGCLQACKGNFFLKESSPEDSFPDTYTYLPKVPKYFLKEWLPTMAPNLKAVVNELDKTDKFAFTKLLYRGFLLESHYKFPTHNKKDFKTILEGRHKKYNEPLAKIRFDSEFNIQWDKCGCYTLLPECPPDKDIKEWTYTDMLFNGCMKVLSQPASLTTDPCAWPANE